MVRLSGSTPFYYGWVVAVVSGAANFSRVSSAVEISSIFVPALANEYGWSRTLIASATTLGGAGSAFAGPFVGRLLDRYGGRLVVPAGGLIVGVSCLTLGVIASPVAFVIVYGVVRSAGQALMLFPNSVVVAMWFEKRRGAATATQGAIGALGLVTMPVAVQVVISGAGISWAWVMLGVLALTMGVAPPAILYRRRPEDLGLLPDGAQRGEHDGSGRARGGATLEGLSLHQALRTPALWVILFASFTVSGSMTGVSFHQLAYYIERGISPGVGATVVATYALGITTGGIAWGWLGDRIHVRWILTGIYVVTVLDIFVLLGVKGPLLAYGFGFVFGTLVGGAMALPTLLLAAFYGRRALGSIAGVVHMSRSFGLGFGPLVAGAFYDTTGSYELAFLSFMAVAGMSAVLMGFVARPPRRPAHA